MKAVTIKTKKRSVLYNESFFVASLIIVTEYSSDNRGNRTT